jgi:dTMP kinase
MQTDKTLQCVADKLSGKFLVLDGPDGAGKGTQLSMLASALAGAGAATVLAKDPGGTEVGDRIRHVLLRYDLAKMDARCETLLFMASRAQLVAEVIRPALAAGKTVLCDRFISATYAYQGAAGMALDEVRRLGDLAVGEFWPDVTVILDLPADEGLARVGRSTNKPGARVRDHPLLFEDVLPDAMEQRSVDFHQRVRELFVKLPQVYPKPVVVVDARFSPDRVHKHVLEALERADF